MTDFPGVLQSPLVSAFMTLSATLEPRCDLVVIQLPEFLAVVKVVVTPLIWTPRFGLGLTLGLCLEGCHWKALKNEGRRPPGPLQLRSAVFLATR